jgi:hypothetical protein
MRRYVFKVEIQGYGSTPDQAYGDAVDSLYAEPGPTPEEFQEFDEEE